MFRTERVTTCHLNLLPDKSYRGRTKPFFGVSSASQEGINAEGRELVCLSVRNLLNAKYFICSFLNLMLLKGSSVTKWHQKYLVNEYLEFMKLLKST